MTIRYTITPSTITVVFDGTTRTVGKDQPNFVGVRELLMKKMLDENIDDTWLSVQLRELIDVRAFIAKISMGRVQVSGDAVQFDGKPAHGHIAERLLTMVRAGRNPRPLMRFMERLDRAVIKDVADQFLHWLEKSNLPLTADGCFIAYKYVDQNFKDQHTHTIDNSPGAVIPRLEPNSINSDREQTCAASGYHFCSYAYLGGSKPVMLLKIDPADVCSFPSTEEAKGRCLFYEIINRIPDDEIEARKIEGGDLLYTGLHAADPSVYHDPEQPVSVPEQPYYHEEEEEPDEEQEEDDDADGEEDAEGYAATCAPVLPVPAKTTAGKTPREKWLARLKGIDYGGKSLTPKRLMKLVAKHGQREASRRTGIPRGTMQDWLR